VRAVPPGTWCAVGLDGGAAEAPVFHPYWRLSDHYCPAPDRPPLAYADALDAVERTLAAAVETHRVADVGVGSLLSGGLDSSLVASLAAASARKAGLDLPVFTVGLGDGGPLDELPFARAVAERDGLVHHVSALAPGWFAATAADAIRAMEEPPLGMAALAQYRAFQLAREHGVTVVLDGQGADEVFGGYPGHQRIFVRDRVVRGRVFEALREVRAMAAQRERAFLPFLAEYVGIGVTRRFPADQRYLDPDLGREPDEEETAAARDFGRDPSPVNRELYHSIRGGNVRIVLPYSDKNAMAHSIEARVPYFDRALVELAFSLPDHFKVGGGQRKRLLRDAGRRRLPRDVTERKDKTGFATGEHEWLKKEMWPQVQAAVESGALASAFFRPGGSARFVADFAAGRHADFRAVWRLCAFANWAAAFEVRLP
jgi:asparagine synthase (glutamine-hydrolysing)